MRSSNLFDDLMGKEKPFIYMEKDRLFIIGGHFYFEEVYDIGLEKLYDKYVKIELNQEDEKTGTKSFRTRLNRERNSGYKQAGLGIRGRSRIIG